MFISLRFLEMGIIMIPLCPTPGASLTAQQVKDPSATQEAWVQSLDWEDFLEKELATTPAVLPEKSRGWSSLVTEQLSACPIPPPSQSS